MRILAPTKDEARILANSLARQWRPQGYAVDIPALDPAPTEISAKRSQESFGLGVPRRSA